MMTDQIIADVYRKDYGALRRAIALGADLNTGDIDGRTPLMHAVLDSAGSEEMVRFLINNGANPDVHDTQQGWTALHFAARDQKLEIAVFLLECGASIDSVDSFGNTPLWRSIMESRAPDDVVRFLVSKGADPNKANRDGVSPKDIAERMGRSELAEILSEIKK